MAVLNMVQTTTIIKHGLAAAWTQKNPLLLNGELGAESDTGLLKLGDGVTLYNDLPYINVTIAHLNQVLQTKLDTAGGIVTGPLTLNYNPSAATDAVNKEYVDALFAAEGHLKRKIVTVLPSAQDADPNTIYLIKDTSSVGPDFYKEYLLIDGVLTQIGDTSVDLTGVLRTPENYVEGDLAAFNADGQLVDFDINQIHASTNVKDLIQDAGDELVLYCGSSTEVI